MTGKFLKLQSSNGRLMFIITDQFRLTDSGMEANYLLPWLRTYKNVYAAVIHSEEPTLPVYEDGEIKGLIDGSIIFYGVFNDQQTGLTQKAVDHIMSKISYYVFRTSTDGKSIAVIDRTQKLYLFQDQEGMNTYS